MSLKITLGRIFLITTLICIVLAGLHAIGFEWLRLLDASIAHFNWIIGNKVSPPKIDTFGQFLATTLGAGFVIAFYGIFVMYGIFFVRWLWKMTEYKEK